MTTVDKPPAPTVEIGYAQTPNYNWWLYEQEFTPELIWPQSISVYDEMRRTDSQVKSVLRAITYPLRRTAWWLDPNGARDEVVEFVANDLGLSIRGVDPKPIIRRRDRFSWDEHLRLALLMLPLGHSYFEQTYRVDEDGKRAHLHKLGQRPAKTIVGIDVATDGGLVSIKQWWTATMREPKPIPVDRLVAYVLDREGGNWLGESLLRSCYKNWLIKDRLLRVQAQTIERNGMGIPLYTGYENEPDLSTGKAMAKAWRSGQDAGSAIPYGAKMDLLGVTGTLPDAESAIRYHDEQIARGVLAHFLNLGTQTGSWALGSTFADFFTLSLQTVGQQVADTTTAHVIEDLVDVNWGRDEPAPKLGFDEIGARPDAAALASLIQAGAIVTDDTLEAALRQQYALPPKDKSTTRDTAQGGGQGAPADGGYPPPSQPPDPGAIFASAGDPDPDDPDDGAEADDEPDEDTWALLAAMEELADEANGAVAAAEEFNPLLHPRDPIGRFRTVIDRLKHALGEHLAGGGKGDPFVGHFSREQLRRAAVQRGLHVRRGASDHEISRQLQDDLKAHLRPGAQLPAPAKAAKKAAAAPRKAAKAVPTPAAPTGRLDVHKIAREQGLDLPAEHLARIQRMLDGEEAVPRASGSPQKNASPAVVGRYLEQWANARHYSAATASSAAAEFRGHGRNDQLSAEAKAAGREGDQLLALGKHLQGLRHAGTRGVAAPGSDAEVHQARTIAELRALAKARGITVPSGLKKDQIREHILSGGTGGAAGPKKLRPGQLIGMDEHALAQAADEGRVSRPEAARRIRDMARQAAATNVFLNGSNETRTSIGEPIAQDILDQRQRDYAQGEQRVAELRALADQVEARPTKATPAQHRGLPQLVAPHGQLPYTDAELRSVQHIAPQFQAEQVARNRAHTIADLLAHTEALRESGASPQAMESRIRSHGKDLTPELVDRLVQVHTPAELDRLASQYGLHRTTPNVGGVEPYNPALHERLPGSPEIPRGTPVQIVRPGYDATVNGQRVQAVKAAVILHEPTETQHLAPAEVQTRIATVYQRLRAAGSSDWVSLTDLRRQPELRNLSSADVDAALKQLAHDPGFHMSPQENQKLLTAADRAAALQMGDRAYHFLHIEPGRGSVAPAPPAPFDPRDVAERITTERGSADQIRATLRGLNSVQLRRVAKELNLTQAIGNLKGHSGDALLEWMVQTILRNRGRFQWR